MKKAVRSSKAGSFVKQVGKLVETGAKSLDAKLAKAEAKLSRPPVIPKKYQDPKFQFWLNRFLNECLRKALRDPKSRKSLWNEVGQRMTGQTVTLRLTPYTFGCFTEASMLLGGTVESAVSRFIEDSEHVSEWLNDVRVGKA